MQKIINCQLGKNKITPNFIELIKTHFKKYKQVRISVLKSARENKECVKKYSQEILKELGENYKARVIGFTIILRKSKKRDGLKNIKS